MVEETAGTMVNQRDFSCCMALTFVVRDTVLAVLAVDLVCRQMAHIALTYTLGPCIPRILTPPSANLPTFVTSKDQQRCYRVNLAHRSCSRTWPTSTPLAGMQCTQAHADRLSTRQCKESGLSSLPPSGGPPTRARLRTFAGASSHLGLTRQRLPRFMRLLKTCSRREMLENVLLIGTGDRLAS